MVATVSCRSKDKFSSHTPTINASDQTIAQQDSKNVQESAETQDSYFSDLRRALVDAISASKIAQRDYEKIQAEAEGWERQLQLALKHSGEDLVYQALMRKRACADKARNLKALVEQHSVQVSTLKSQLAFWENQI